MNFQFNNAGRKRPSLDCVARALAITLGLPYRRVCRELDAEALTLGQPCDALSGVRFATYQSYLAKRGWLYAQILFVRRSATPERLSVAKAIPHSGRYVVRTPGHLASVVDGTVHDTFDSRGRAALGFFYKVSRNFRNPIDKTV